MHVSKKRAVAGGLLTALTLVLVAFFANDSATAANHGEVVGEIPRRNVPVVLDGTVFAHEQVGDRIFVGGDFDQVQRPDGSVITQANIFAYNVNTGLLDESFRPTVNNGVFALELNPAENALYAGGRFTAWNGSFPTRVAKLSVTGALDTSFQGSANAIVRSMAVNNNNVYLAGDFTTVSGQPRAGFAAINVNSGFADPNFVMNVQNSVNAPELARGIVLNSAGTRAFGLHYGTHINGTLREALAQFNTNNGSLVNWSVDWSGQAVNRDCLGSLRDLAISPNNSFIVIGGQGADNPPNCDSVLRYPTSGTGVIDFDWVARMYSSVFSLAVSDTAVYVGGHFCAAPRNPIPAGGISHPRGDDGTANGCNINNPNDEANPSVRFPDHAVFREQLAALNPSNGQALPWNPGSNAGLATFDLTVVERGLLAGQDNNRFNDVLTGRSGFFDLGGPADTEAPTVAISSPANGSVATSVSALTGTAADNVSVSGVTVRLKNQTTDQWLQPNGSSFAAAQANAPVTLTPTANGSVNWNVAIGTTLTPGNYEIRTFSADPGGRTSPTLVTSFTIPGAQSCSVALNGAGVPRITWNGFANVASVSVRRNGTFLALGAPQNDFHDDSTAVAGSSYSYAVRWRPNGSNVDVACSPTSFTVPTAAAADVTPPVLGLTTGLAQAPGVRNLTGPVTDDISGVDRVQVTVLNQQTGQYWNGNAWQNGWVWNLATLGNGTWTLPNVDLSLTGTYEMQFWAFDNEGNRARNSDNIKPIITVAAGGGGNNPPAPGPDVTPPVVGLTTGLNQSVGVRNLNGSVTDDISGVDRVRVLVQNQQTSQYWNGNAWQNAWAWNLATLNGNSWTVPNVNLNPSGRYSVLMWAWDNENNRANWDVNPQPVINVN